MNIQSFTQKINQSEEPLLQALSRLQQTSLEKVKSHQKFAGWQVWNQAS